VAGTIHDRAPSHDGGSMIGFVLMNEKLPETETRQATRGKWIILEGKDGEWCVFMFTTPKVVALA
jgi:hypothetical protein